jgi:small subunit ribosomal protein S1
MSNPDTPSQTPTPNGSGSATASPTEGDSHSPNESASNGQATTASEGMPAQASEHAPEAAPQQDARAHDSHDSPDDSHDDSGSEEAPVEGGADQASAAEAPHGEKKRRRRRRKKRPGGQGAVEGAVAPDGTETPGVDGEGASAKPSDKPEKREPRREKKQGPPRERPPVNAGDIVFGKILEINDDAIVIDIPGKAHAIFDRREMLLSDDDEPVAAAPTEVAEGEAPQVSEGAAEAAGIAEGAGAVASEAAPEDPLAVPSADAVPAEPPEPAVVEAAPVAETPRDPKVPHVILEVGADFIGVVHSDGARGGLVVLTHHPKRLEKAKPLVEKAFKEKTTILGLVTGVIKGGVEVDVDGLRAFAPGSHVDLRLGTDLSHLVAKRLPFYVTEYAKRGRDVVLSRRTILEEESRKARTEALSKLKVGEELDGMVRSVVPFGAFVDVGGIEGLVPLQEMSHNRADGPNDVFKVGEPTRVTVTKIDERGKVWLSHKATIPDPWQKVAQKYAVGTRHAGKIVRLQPFGAFVELESGVDGLLHTQDLSIKRIETPDELVKVGDAIDVVVAHVDPSNHKIALHPALQGASVDEAPQKVAPYKPVKAEVVMIESGGLVVRILGVTGRNARGYVTASGTGTPRGTELRKAFKVGQQVDGKVIEMDPRRGEVKLSIKALSEDQERNAYQQYRQQLKAEARVTFGDLLAKKGNLPR